MRKALILLILLLSAFVVGAQNFDPATVDLSKIKWETAQFSLAGPDKIYVRTVGYEGQATTLNMVITLSFSADGGLKATFGAPASEGMLDQGEVAYAKASAEVGRLKISPIVMADQKAYTVWFALDGTATAKLVDFKELAGDVYTNTVQNLIMARIQLKKLAEGLYAQQVTDKAAADKSKADAVAAEKAVGTKALADAAAAKKEADAAKADADAAKKAVAAAQADADSYKVQLSVLKAQAASAATTGKPLPPIDRSKLDFSKARVSVAGPTSLYVRNILYGGEAVSLLLNGSLDGTVTASGPFFKEEKVIWDTDEAAYAAITAIGPNTLELSPIIVDGKAYTGVLEWLANSNKFNIVSYRPAAMPVQYEQMAAALAAAQKMTAAPAAAPAVSTAELDAAKKAAATAQADADAAKKAAAAAQADADAAKKATATAQLTSDQFKAELNLLKSMAAGSKAIPAIDASKLNFSQARATIAGPNLIYLRNILYAGEPVSVLLSVSADGSVSAQGPFFKEQKVIQDSYEIAYVGVTPVAANSLQLSPVIVEGQAYSGILEWKPGTNQFAITSYKSVDMPLQYTELAAALAGAQKGSADAKTGADKSAAEAADLKKQVADLQAKLEQAAKAPGQMVLEGAPAYEKPSMVSFKGFTGGKGDYGTWKLAEGVLNQSNAGLKFAKYVVPVDQYQTEMLYSFTAKAKIGDWTGYGVHFLGSDSKVSNTYGFGNSYLVWLTRDLNFYQVPTTYVQLYRSYDDGKMVQLASVNIPESIGDELQTEVIYNSDLKRVMISVNGTQRLSYAVDSAITMGNRLAFRTLGGPVDFMDFAIKTR